MKNMEDVSDGYHTFGELYEVRDALYMALCTSVSTDIWPVWMSKQHNDGSEYCGYFLLGIGKEKGKQITFHLSDKYWEKCRTFAEYLEKAPEWDGHTTADVVKRIHKYFI